MKLFNLLGALGLFASPALAVPGQYYPPTCKASKCLSSLNSEGARQSCNSFLEKTVTPCPVIAVVTKTCTVTKPTRTVTQSRDVVNQVTQIVVKPVTSTVTTIFETVTKTISSDILITSTFVIPATTTFEALSKRTLQCSQKTGSATALPSCAKACLGAAQFSSACSCIGATGKTVTAKRPTTTSTLTTTRTIAPVVTVTKGSTLTSVRTSTKTTVVPASFKTIATVAVTDFHTDVTVVSVTGTGTAAAPPACTTYAVMVAFPVQNTMTTGFLSITPRVNTEIVFNNPETNVEVRGNKLYLAGQDAEAWVLKNINPGNLRFISADRIGPTISAMSGITCALALGAEIPLQCQSTSGEERSEWQVCSENDSYYLALGTQEFGDGCVAVSSMSLVESCAIND